jgi:hypothetical protein
MRYGIGDSGHYYSHRLYRSTPGSGGMGGPRAGLIDSSPEFGGYMNVLYVEVRHSLDRLEGDTRYTQSLPVCRDTELMDRRWAVDFVSGPV